MESPADTSRRVLVFAPVGRDAALTRDLLQRHAIDTVICASIAETCGQVQHGCAAVIVTEEVFEQPDYQRLPACLQAQPPWSDIPVLMFAGSEGRAASTVTIGLLESFPNVTLLDRPIRIAVAISLVHASIRARRRQLELRDLLTALDAARQEAEDASRLKDEFLATLSHELRTPLNAILGWTTMLRHGEVEPSRVVRALEVIDRNAHAQARLVEEVLDMARVITGKLRLDLQPLRLKPVVEAAIEAVRPAADARSIRISFDAVPRATEVRGDADRLQQVFWNLLSNAVKFTPPGGEVSVMLDNPDGDVRISVTDTGIGVDAAFLPFVFDRFRQADQSVTRGHGGLGLGLAIVKHLVELHGGRVEAQSEGPGRGSRFRVLIPIARPEAGPAPLDADAGAFAMRFAGRHLLVVDDDPGTRELLGELFGRAEALVTCVESTVDAFEAVRSRRPDVIIADIGLPDEDGNSLMRRIRKLPAPEGTTPAIALSAYTRAQDRQVAFEAGFTEFIGKPAAPQDILRAVDRVLTPTRAS